MSKMEFYMAWKKLLLLVTCSMMSVCFAQDGSLLSENASFSQTRTARSGKVYVPPDLDATAEKISDTKKLDSAISDVAMPVSALFRDERGFYVMESQLEQGYSLEQCPNGHVSRHNDGRCNHRSCPYFRG